MYVEKTIEATLLLRFDSYNKLFNNYNNKQLIFSCPANWLNLALKNFSSEEKDIYKENVGDVLECIFAKTHTKNFKSDNYVDHYGKPLGRNLFIINTIDGKSFLFHQQRLLTPALCFYSINGRTIYNKIPKPVHSDFQVQQYAIEYFGNSNLNDKGVLVIFNPHLFWEDLDLHINSALKSYSSRLTKKGFYQTSSISSGNNFLAQNVEYCSFYENETFNIENDTLDEMFCKSRKFENQSEARIIIPNINFRERLEDIESYKYQSNELPISLPKLHSYAKLFRLSEIKSIPVFRNSILHLRYWQN